jgi:hypothetical protein
MILRLTTGHENALSPLGERVARDGAFSRRAGWVRGSGFAIFMAVAHARVLAGTQKP